MYSLVFLLLCGLIALYLLRVLVPIGLFPFAGRGRRELDTAIEHDLIKVGQILEGLERTMARLEAGQLIFRAKTVAEIDERSKREMLEAWSDFLDYQAALGVIVDEYAHFYQISFTFERALHAKAFLLGYVAFVSAFASGVKFLELVDGNELFDLILNDVRPELGIPQGAYDALRLRIVGFDDATRLAFGYGHFQFLQPIFARIGVRQTHVELFDRIEQSFAFATTKLGEKALAWIPQNGARLLQVELMDAIFPIQKSVARTLGETRIGPRHGSLITERQIAALRPQLRPGDILLERRNWYVSNVGIPGFWPHIALFLGSSDELVRTFRDPSVKGFLRERGWSDIGEALRDVNPAFAKAYFGGEVDVIEAKAEGVVLTELTESARADSVAVLRPNLRPIEICQAILEAARHFGKPYDYRFDFVTDSALVCSELVYKAYKSFIDMPLSPHAGRMIVSPNAFARFFDDHADFPDPPLTFVAFLDARESEGVAFFADAEAMRGSWQRPKWDLRLE